MDIIFLCLTLDTGRSAWIREIQPWIREIQPWIREIQSSIREILQQTDKNFLTRSK